MVDEGSTEAMVCHGCVLSVRWRWIFVALISIPYVIKTEKEDIFLHAQMQKK